MPTSADELLTRLSERLSSEADIVVAIVFGSAASGDLRSESDIDVAVLGTEPLSVDRRRELTEAIADVGGRPVDLVDFRTSGVAVTRAALTQGKTIVCRDRAAYARLVSRMLLDSADFLPYRECILRERRTSWIR